VVLLSHQ